MVVVSPLNSLQARLTAAVLLVFVVSVWLFSSWMSRAMRAEEQRLLHQQQRAEVSMLAAQIDAALDVRFRALENVAADLARRQRLGYGTPLDLLQQRPILQTLFNADVITVDTRRTVRARWPQLLDGPQANSAVEPFSATAGRAVQVFFEYRQWWVWLSVPVFSEQGLALGWLVGRERLDADNFLQATLERHHTSAGALALLQSDGRRRVLASFVSAPGAAAVAMGEHDLVLSSASGAEIHTDAQGAQWLISRHPTETAPWVVGASTSASQVFAGLYARQGQMLVATMYLTLLAGGVIWWVIRWHLAPMKDAIAKLAAQAAAERPEAMRLHTQRKDEVGVLIAGFNQVLDSVDRHEQALRRSEKQLTDILDHIDSHVYLKDRQGHYLFANRSMCHSLDRPLQEVVGHDDREFYDSSTCDELVANDRKVFLTRQVLRADETVVGYLGKEVRTFMTVKIPMRNEQGEVEALCGISTDITQRKLQETDLRIAAAAFECQEGIVVLAADLSVLRVNSAFCRLTGYDTETALAQVEAFVHMPDHAVHLRQEIAPAVRHSARWRGVLHISCADARVMVAKVTVSAVLDSQGHYTHYVVHVMDDTAAQLQERQRLEQEAAHRVALVREVHHRIKNNLQGILALMRQFAHMNAELAKPMQEVIGQVHAISTIHGLQGKSAAAQMRLCELVDAIAEEVAAVWRRPVQVHRALPWQPWCLAELEAVPVALILHELLLNAVKHAGSAEMPVSLHLRRSESVEGIELCLYNPGTWSQDPPRAPSQGNGLALIEALMPRHGATLRHWQDGEVVCTWWQLGRPIIMPESLGG